MEYINSTYTSTTHTDDISMVSSYYTNDSQNKKNICVIISIWIFVISMAIFIVTSSMVTIYVGLYLVSGANSQIDLILVTIFGVASVGSISILMISCIFEIVYKLIY